MKIYKVLISENAKRDLSGIYRYISFELMQVSSAKSLIHKMLKAISSLELLPSRHSLYHNEIWKAKGLRFFRVANYLVFYVVNEEKKNVKVMRIFYVKRDIESELNKLA